MQTEEGAVRRGESRGRESRRSGRRHLCDGRRRGRRARLGGVGVCLPFARNIFAHVEFMKNIWKLIM